MRRSQTSPHLRIPHPEHLRYLTITIRRHYHQLLMYQRKAEVDLTSPPTVKMHDLRLPAAENAIFRGMSEEVATKSSFRLIVQPRARFGTMSDAA